MKTLWVFLMFAFWAARLSAQIEILGFSDDLANGVRAAFPNGSSQMESAIGKVAGTVGNNGDARIDYVNQNGDFRGAGVSGTVSTFVNFGLGELFVGDVKVGVEISWKCELGPDGYVHIIVTVTVYSLNGAVKKEINIKTACTNSAAKNASAAPVVVSTRSISPTRAASPSSTRGGGRDLPPEAGGL